jgi:hypothetical protein
MCEGSSDRADTPDSTCGSRLSFRCIRGTRLFLTTVHCASRSLFSVALFSVAKGLRTRRAGDDAAERSAKVGLGGSAAATCNTASSAAAQAAIRCHAMERSAVCRGLWGLRCATCGSRCPRGRCADAGWPGGAAHCATTLGSSLLLLLPSTVAPASPSPHRCSPPKPLQPAASGLVLELASYRHAHRAQQTLPGDAGPPWLLFFLL